MSGEDTIEVAAATPEAQQPYKELGLTGDEYQKLRDILGRRPTAAELAPAEPASAALLAGICNAAGNVLGLMPHPEHAVDPLTGPSADGLGFFTSVVAGQEGGFGRWAG